MAQPTVNVGIEIELGDVVDKPVKAASKIVEGAFVSNNGNFMHHLVGGEPFEGIAQKTVDNTAGADGDLHVELVTRGKIVRATNLSLTTADEGKDIFMDEGNNFSLTGGAGQTRVGHIETVMVNGDAIIVFQARTGVVTSLTDSSGGAASDTIAVIGATYSQSEVQDAIASLAAKVNNLLECQNNG